MIGKCEDIDGPVRSILSRTGLEEAGDRGVGALEGIRRSGLCRRAAAMAAGGEIEESGGADVAVSRVGPGTIIPELRMSRLSQAMAGSGKATGMPGHSMVV